MKLVIIVIFWRFPFISFLLKLNFFFFLANTRFFSVFTFSQKDLFLEKSFGYNFNLLWILTSGLWDCICLFGRNILFFDCSRSFVWSRNEWSVSCGLHWWVRSKSYVISPSTSLLYSNLWECYDSFFHKYTFDNF